MRMAATNAASGPIKWALDGKRYCIMPWFRRHSAPTAGPLDFYAQYKPDSGSTGVQSDQHGDQRQCA